MLHKLRFRMTLCVSVLRMSRLRNSRCFRGSQKRFVFHELLDSNILHCDPDVTHTETKEHEEIVWSLRGYSRKKIPRETLNDNSKLRRPPSWILESATNFSSPEPSQHRSACQDCSSTYLERRSSPVEPRNRQRNQ